MRADFHMHSTQSDGDHTREAVLALAVAAGLQAISFTEHDSAEGAAEGVSLAATFGLRAVPGIEISAIHPTEPVKLHILGLGYTDPAPLTALCAPTLRRREENCLRQIEILRTLGYAITEEAVRPYAAACLYKQHILQYLYDSGQSETLFGEVYQTIFKHGGVCDFDIDYVSAVDAVEAILAAGGLPILAHPGQQNAYFALPLLCEAGLAGIELFHPSHSPEDHRTVRAAAMQHGLFLSGGSDFHGGYERIPSEVGAYCVPEDSALFGGLGMRV